MSSVYVERRVGNLVIGYAYFLDTNEYQIKEQISDNQAVRVVNVEDVPEDVKKAISILLAEGN